MQSIITQGIEFPCPQIWNLWFYTKTTAWTVCEYIFLVQSQGCEGFLLICIKVNRGNCDAPKETLYHLGWWKISWWKTANKKDLYPGILFKVNHLIRLAFWPLCFAEWLYHYTETCFLVWLPSQWWNFHWLLWLLTLVQLLHANKAWEHKVFSYHLFSCHFNSGVFKNSYLATYTQTSDYHNRNHRKKNCWEKASLLLDFHDTLLGT